MKINKNKCIILIVAICAMTSTAWAVFGSGTCTIVTTYKCDGCGTQVEPTETESVNNHCTETRPDFPTDPICAPLVYWASKTHLEKMPITCLEYPECAEDN